MDEVKRRAMALVYSAKDYFEVSRGIEEGPDRAFEAEWTRVAQQVIDSSVLSAGEDPDPRTCNECRSLFDSSAGAIYNYKHRGCLEYLTNQSAMVERRATLLAALWAESGKVARLDLLAWAAALMERLFIGRGLNQEDIKAWRRAYERGQESTTAAAKVAKSVGPAIYCQSEEDPL